VRLEGTLDAFGLPDILQLLAFTRKSGALRLSAPPAAGVVRVREGAICAASSDTSRQVLARRIIGAGLVDDDALRRAVDSVRPDHGVVAGLLEAGAVDEQALLPLAAEQATDAVGELLRWTGGEFSFVVDDADPDPLPLQLAVDEVVAEGQRRRSVWDELVAVIPSTEVALTLAVAPAEDPRCSREEWGLLALVDGSRTVTQIVALLGRSEFAVVRSLAALVTRGLLVVPGAAGPGGGFVELSRRQALLGTLEGGSPHAAEPLPSAAAIPTQPAPHAEPAGASAAPLTPTVTASAGPATGPSTGSATGPVVTVSAAHTSGSSALAPDAQPLPLPAPEPQPETRPTLTLAGGAQDAPVRRSLLLQLPTGSAG
jgi:hypothetical protein